MDLDVASLSKAIRACRAPFAAPWRALWSRASLTFATVSVVVLGGCATAPEKCHFLTCVDEGAWNIEVVPASWMTFDGSHLSSHFAEGAGRSMQRDPPSAKVAEIDQDGHPLWSGAYTFPSLPINGSAVTCPQPPRGDSDPCTRSIDGFFRADKTLSHETFRFRPKRNDDSDISIDLQGDGTKATLTVGDASYQLIRSLSWHEFHHLQTDFKDWVCGRWWYLLFESCDHRVGLGFNEGVRDFFLNNLLKDAVFKTYADQELWSEKATPIKGTGNQSNKEMLAIKLIPNQILRVRWGASNLYPMSGASDFGGVYSRIGPAGSLDIQPHLDYRSGRMRLFPERTVEFTTDVETGLKDNNPRPYPNPLKAVVGKDFLPIYNDFDLHNGCLLRAIPENGNCDSHERQYPINIYLLSPTSYRKPDSQKGFANFENESRVQTDSGNGEDDLSVLTKQFILMGCDNNNIEQEWNYLLDDVGYYITQTRQNLSRGCGGNFVHGVFSGKSFVEVRNHFSLDGHLVEGGSALLQTVGEVISAQFPSRVGRERPVGSDEPMVYLVRGIFGKRPPPFSVEIRFFTTSAVALDAITVSEGDQIYVSSVPKGVRQ